MFKRKGQSTLEYILVLTALVGLFLWFATNGTISSSITNLFDSAQEIMNNAATAG